MTAKEYLSRYHNIKRKIELLQAEVDEYIRLANSIPGINFDQIRVDGTKNLEAPFEKWIQKALENEIWIADMKAKLPTIKGEIISVIHKIEEDHYRMVMIYRYIEWLSWADIAERMYYSVATIRRWHDKALLEISVPT